MVRHPWSSQVAIVNNYGDTKDVLAPSETWERDYWLYMIAHSYGHVELYYSMGIHLQRKRDNEIKALDR